MKPPRTCLLLLNGNRARFVYHSGPGQGFESDKNGEMSGPNLHGRDINADRPGRAFDRKGAGRHAMEYSTDPVKSARKEFFKDVVGKLEKEHAARDFSRLILVAPPRILSEFSPMLPPKLNELLYETLQKDLTQVPINDLSPHLESVMVP